MQLFIKDVLCNVTLYSKLYERFQRAYELTNA